MEELGQHTANAGMMQTHRAQAWLAALGVSISGSATLQEGGGPTLTDPNQALPRLQRGPLASAALTTLPTSRATRIDPQPFRVWTSRTWPPLRSVFEGWGVGKPKFSRGTGGSSGVQGGKRTLVWTGSSEIWTWEPSTSRMHAVLRSVDGLSLWHGAQLAVDTTVVSPLHGDGSARGQAARRAKEHVP